MDDRARRPTDTIDFLAVFEDLVKSHGCPTQHVGGTIIQTPVLLHAQA